MQRIRRGQFVKMRYLLTYNISLLQHLEQMQPGSFSSQQPTPSPCPSQPWEISSLMTWVHYMYFLCNTNSGEPLNKGYVHICLFDSDKSIQIWTDRLERLLGKRASSSKHVTDTYWQVHMCTWDVHFSSSVCYMPTIKAMARDRADTPEESEYRQPCQQIPDESQTRCGGQR